MAGIPIGPLGTLVVQLASKVQELGNNYYAADSAWRDFPFQVELLQTKHACLEAQLKKYGQDTFTLELGRVLLEAKKLMVDEVDTLKKRKALEMNTLSGWSNRSAIVLGRLGAMIFSEKVGSAIRSANGAYDRFVEHLKARQESEDTLRVSTSRSPIPLSFRKDCKNCYVPFHDSESDIRSSLTSAGPGSPTVILLYGGPGTGKSTVTRVVSSDYAEHKSLFDHLILLECRPALDVQAKEVELIQKLGWNDLGEISFLHSEVEVDGSKFIRESRLRSLLGGQKLLIVLDDLQEPQFLQNLLVLSGPGVKYLVTSPLKDLCENLNCISQKFQIENLHHQSMKETSKKMLAAHIGFADQLIPENFQEIADSILDKAEGIPLVIATLGAQIGDGDKDDPAVWKSVSNTFLECLNEIPSKYIHGIPYPRSYWLALTQSIDVLNREEKRLLILIGMCKGPSVPKVVVFSLFSILCPNGKSSFYRFSKMRIKLLNRQLIFETSARDKHLSVHSLTKRFIVEEIEDTKSIAQSFSHEFEDSHTEAKEHKGFVKKPSVTSVLVCLYLDIKFGKAIAERIGHSIDTFSASKKITIEPITQQLLEPEVNWTQELEASASQVFLEFVCNDSLCHDQLSQLLQCPTWVMSTLKFLESISLLDKSFWEKNTIQDIPSRLQSILGDRVHPDFQIQAAHTLAGLVSYRLNREKILSTTGALDQLVSLMSQDQNDDLQCSGAKFFVACSLGDRDHFHDHDTLQKLVQFPPLLPTLVTSLGNDRNDRLQRQASRALINLASTPYTSLKARLFESPQLLESLVASLRKSHNPDLQANAANVIANLAGLGADQAMKERVASFPELIQNLENSLYQDGNLNVRVEAAGVLIRLAWTKDNPKLLQSLAVSFEKEEDPILRGRALGGLAYLAYKDDMIPDQILSFPGLLENLVKSLNDDVNCGLVQEEAARALQNLACNAETYMVLKLVSSPLLLESLVASLGRCQNPSLQANAAGAVANLAGSGADQAIREQIARCPGLLDNLENSLDQDDNPRLQVEAARALVNLESIKDIRKLLQGLTVPFQRNQGAFLRENTLVGLSGLARMDDVIKDQILSFPGLLENLVKSLDNDLNCGLQTLAAGRICNLASAMDTSIKVRILRSAGLLKSLVASLENFQNPDLQTNAAWAIRFLAGKGADQAVREQIANFPGLLDSLEKSLDQGDNANLQVEAAIALMNLAYTKVTAKLLRSLAVSFETNQDFFFQEEALRGLADLACGDDTIKDQILTFPGLFHSLIKSLENERSRERQWHAARALSNLACAKDTIVKARISNSPLLLECLVVSLGKVENPGLQSHAASAIANLSGAGADAEMRHNIANFPRLLDELVKSLDNDENSRLQEDAALALSNLPHSLDAEIQSKIASLLLRSS